MARSRTWNRQVSGSRRKGALWLLHRCSSEGRGSRVPRCDMAWESTSARPTAQHGPVDGRLIEEASHSGRGVQLEGTVLSLSRRSGPRCTAVAWVCRVVQSIFCRPGATATRRLLHCIDTIQDSTYGGGPSATSATWEGLWGGGQLEGQHATGQLVYLPSQRSMARTTTIAIRWLVLSCCGLRTAASP